VAAVGVHVGDVGFEFDVWVEVADVSKGMFQPLWLVGLVRSSTHRPHQLRNHSKNTIMAAQASSITRRCHVAIKLYQNC
jgi:hypothetical protein